MKINFYIDSKKDKDGKAKILLYISYGGKRFTIYTKEKCLPNNWMKNQRVSKKEIFAFEINQVLDHQEGIVRKIFQEAKLKGKILSKEYIKSEFFKFLGLEKQSDKTFFEFYDEFIHESSVGIRTTSRGITLRKNTLKSYRITRLRLKEFNSSKNFPLAFETINEKFYKDFTSYLWDDLDYFDNTTGRHLKNIKTFLNWAFEKGYTKSLEHKKKYFRVWSEEKDIIVLNPSQLNMLIDADIPSKKLDRVRDISVMGCTITLRISDLLALSENNLLIEGGQYKIKIITQKTGKNILIDLPDHAKKIIDKYRGQYKTLLPKISDVKFNKYLKELGKYMEWDKISVEIFKYKRGVAIPRTTSFDKLLTSHVMRRTGITTLLILGMDEISVKRISGHSMNSKSFHKYVLFSEQYINNKFTSAWDKFRKNDEFNPNSGVLDK